ncbi:MAG: hypothetical protein ABIW80_11900 [Lapillicoccus sp.]
MEGRPRQNRVTPTGDIVAIPLRGAWMGNRGILHDEVSGPRGEVVRRHAGALWITCTLSFRGWRAAQWAPHHYTVLFFHDEAVALAAGHRPCALCRRAAYDAYRAALAAADGAEPLRANEIDRRLHTERLVPRSREKRLHRGAWADVPDGAFAIDDGKPVLVRGSLVVPWTVAGYGPPRRRPRWGAAVLLTPPTTLAVLREGYVPQVDPSALA